MYVVMRAPKAGDPRLLTGAVREQLGELDPALPVADVRLMEDVLLAGRRPRPRFPHPAAGLLFSFVFPRHRHSRHPTGVVSYSVARRTKEFWFCAWSLALKVETSSGW